MREERIMCYDHKVNPEEVPTYWLKEYCPTCLRAENMLLKESVTKLFENGCLLPARYEP